MSAAVRRSPFEQVKRYTERRRTAANQGESGATMVKMVVKDRCPHLRGHPADSSDPSSLSVAAMEGSSIPAPLITGMAVARTIPRPPVDAPLVPQSHPRGSSPLAVVPFAHVSALHRLPASALIRRGSERVAVPLPNVGHALT